MHWFTYAWWCYLLTGRNYYGRGSYYPTKSRWGWTRFWCRLRGHPDGPVWQNVGGLEPDMHCQNCDDNLG